MRIHSFIKVFVAVLTIAFAVTMGTVPVSAQVQPRVSASNVTQVRIYCPGDVVWCGLYDKIAPNRWVQRTQDGKAFPFLEYSHDNNTISLSDDSRRITLEFFFSDMTYRASISRSEGGGTITTVRGPSRMQAVYIERVYEISADNSPETCSQLTTALGVKCNCDLGSLRPLQGAVGMEEVRDKTDKIVNEQQKKRFDLAYDPIKLVRGPNGVLYVTDHHHGARAWLEAGHTMGTCQIQSEVRSSDLPQFWADLNARKLVRLADQNGNPITETQLPTKLRALPDDPYRTLAWLVRKKDGFCRALMTGNEEFAEFQWADWLRTRITPSPREGQDWSKRKRDEAVALAKTPAAAGLPGYRGDKPPGYTCPADPD
jgi:hypothetical protein